MTYELGNTTSTTESVTVDSYASISRRIGAFLIDSLILGVLGAIAGSILPVLGAIIAWFFYAPVLECSAVRATLGKYLMGIQVADLMGRRISLRASLIRNLLKLVSAAILFIGFFFALFTRRKQTLHDMLADTLVVYGRSDIPVSDAWLETTKDVFRAGKAGWTEATSSSSTQSESVVTQLERLQTLYKAGGLTESEYEAAKKKVLG